jgi:cytoskeletal protein CcmA (bactofilin family)
MFSKTDKDKGRTTNVAATPAKAAPSIISANLHIIGNLKTDGEMQVDGSIEGDVTARALTVGEKASINGEIIADDIEIHGSVSGKIKARKVQLAKTAKVVGDIWHETLAIESGAYIEGQLKRGRRGGEDEREDGQPVRVKPSVAKDRQFGVAATAPGTEKTEAKVAVS